jgi:drug/metabolite transporter (DMT)-like permease
MPKWLNVKGRSLVELHSAVFLFGVAGLFGKLLTVGPTSIVFGRTVFAALSLLVVLRLAKASFHLGSTRTAMTLFASGVVLAAHWVTFFHAIQMSTVAIGLIGYATFPVFVTLLEPLLFRAKYSVVDVTTAGAVMVGLVIVAPSFDPSDAATRGLLWAVTSGFLYAVVTLMNRRLVERTPFLVVAFYQHSSATVALVPFLFLVEAIVPDLQGIGLLILLGILCTALPQTLFIKALTTVKAQLASVVAGLEPIYGIALAALLLGEIPGLTTLLGAAVVIGAVGIAMWAHAVTQRRRGDNPPPEVE